MCIVQDTLPPTERGEKRTVPTFSLVRCVYMRDRLSDVSVLEWLVITIPDKLVAENAAVFFFILSHISLLKNTENIHSYLTKMSREMLQLWWILS